MAKREYKLSHLMDNVFQQAVSHHQRGGIDKAINLYKRVVARDPNNKSAWLNLAAALRSQKKFKGSWVCYQRAIVLAEDDPDLWSNYGNLLVEMERFDEADEAHQKALSLSGITARRLYNAGLSPFYSNRPVLALRYFDQVLEMKPDYHECVWNKSLALLQLGNLTDGFNFHEVRWRLPKTIQRSMQKKRWRGESLEGRRVLVIAEQGYGDMIQFSRFTGTLVRRGATVILEARAALLPLMRCLKGVSEVIEKEQPYENYDYYIPLISIPSEIGLSTEDLSYYPYQFSLPKRKERDLTTGNKLFKVGIVWAGKLSPRDRSCPLRLLLPLLAHSDVQFFSFQVDKRVNDLVEEGVDGLVMDLSPNINNFLDSASYMQKMDLFITIDSAPAHLAGALGVPVWALLLHHSDWRWLLECNDSPWYDSMRLFRQHDFGDWSHVGKELTMAFEQWVDNKRHSLQ